MKIDSQTVWTLVGLALTIGTFLVSYKKTFGARKERIRSSNKEVIELLLKRLVLENFMPNRDELGRIIFGKAREQMVNVHDLLSTEEIIDCIYAKIIDNDFINPNQRSEIVQKLNNSYKLSDEQVYEEKEKAEKVNSYKARKNIAAKRIVYMLGILSSLMASIATVIIKYSFAERHSYLRQQKIFILLFLYLLRDPWS